MTKKRVGMIVVGGLAAALLVWAFQPQPESVDLAEVVRGDVAVRVEEEGETRVRDRFVVSAPLAARVLRIELEPGDPVRADETVLATLQPSDPTLLDSRTRAEAREAVRAAESALGTARAERARADAALQFSEKDLQRIRKLADEEIVSREQLDAAELQLDERRQAAEATRFAVETARHQVALAKSRLLEPVSEARSDSPIQLRSPIDGVVLRRNRESESVVAPGEPLLELGDPAQLEIVSDLLSRDAVRVEAGDPVTIDRWGGDRPLEGRVRRVEPSGFTKISALGVEEQRVNIVVDFQDAREAWKALGDGYRVEIAVEIDRAKNAVTVPTSALLRAGEGWAVFRREGEVARLVPVELGLRNELVAEIRSGVSEGETVIVHPGDGVADGKRIRERGL